MICTIMLLAMVGCASNDAADNHVNRNSINLKSDLSQLELLDKSKLSIAIASDYPPFESFKSLQPVGLDIDISYQICHDLNLGLAFNNGEFDQIFDKLKNNKNDIAISGIAITEDRLKQFDFSIPYFQDTKCAVVKKNGSINESNIETALNNPSKPIVCQAGSTSVQYVEKHYPNSQILKKNTNEECIKALENDEAEVFIVEISYYDNKLANEYLNAKNFDWAEKFGIAINKNCPNLKAAIDEVIQARLDDGTIDNMIKEHFK